jgi:hypothetical protein
MVNELVETLGTAARTKTPAPGLACGVAKTRLEELNPPSGRVRVTVVLSAPAGMAATPLRSRGIPARPMSRRTEHRCARQWAL